MTRSRIAACILLVLVLPSCQTFLRTDSVEHERRADQVAPPPYPAFNAALEKEYIAIAHRKLDEADYERVGLFIRKGLAAGTGQVVLPEKPEDWLLPEVLAGELSVARRQLLRALERGARAQSPREAAHTQAMYDCWIDQQDVTETRQPAGHAAVCRRNFWGALALIELVIAPKPEHPEPQPGPAPEITTQLYLAYSPLDESAR